MKKKYVSPEIEVVEKKKYVSPEIEVVEKKKYVSPEIEVVEKKKYVSPEIEVVEKKKRVKGYADYLNSRRKLEKKGYTLTDEKSVDEFYEAYDAFKRGRREGKFDESAFRRLVNSEKKYSPRQTKISHSYEDYLAERKRLENRGYQLKEVMSEESYVQAYKGFRQMRREGLYNESTFKKLIKHERVYSPAQINMLWAIARKRFGGIVDISRTAILTGDQTLTRLLWDEYKIVKEEQKLLSKETGDYE